MKGKKWKEEKGKGKRKTLKDEFSEEVKNIGVVTSH